MLGEPNDPGVSQDGELDSASRKRLKLRRLIVLAPTILGAALVAAACIAFLWKGWTAVPRAELAALVGAIGYIVFVALEYYIVRVWRTVPD